MTANPVVSCNQVETCCCPSMPERLIATISDPLGDCECGDDTEFELVYDADKEYWEGSTNLSACEIGITVRLKCEVGIGCEDSLKVKWTGDTFFEEYPPDGVSCSPYVGEWSGITGGGSECESIAVTVTEA